MKLSLAFWRWGGPVTDAADALISIHRGYADAILAGTKTVELRRKLPDMPVGTRLWIYATRPTAAVIGFATIQGIQRSTPNAIWRRHRVESGLLYRRYSEYFEGTQEAIAILIAAARRIGPITLDQLREIRGGFHPPQVITWLSAHESRSLREIALPTQIIRQELTEICAEG
jgi:predicted transcriptional regulator